VTVGDTTIKDGEISVGGTTIKDGQISGIKTVSGDYDAVNKKYVDDKFAQAGGLDLSAVKGDIADLQDKYKRVKKLSKAGSASAAALGMVSGSATGTGVGMAFTHYEGQGAGAAAFSQNVGPWKITTAASVDSQKKSMQGISFFYGM